MKDEDRTKNQLIDELVELRRRLADLETDLPHELDVERRRAEEALRNCYDFQEELVIERTAELRATNEQLQTETARRKQGDAVLRKIDDELESRVEQRTTELAKTNTGLQQQIARYQRLERQIQGSLEHRTRQVQASTEVAQEIAAAPALPGSRRGTRPGIVYCAAYR